MSREVTTTPVLKDGYGVCAGFFGLPLCCLEGYNLTATFLNF